MDFTKNPMCEARQEALVLPGREALRAAWLGGRILQDTIDVRCLRGWLVRCGVHLFLWSEGYIRRIGFLSEIQ